MIGLIISMSGLAIVIALCGVSSAINDLNKTISRNLTVRMKNDNG